MTPCNFIDPTANINIAAKVWHFAVIREHATLCAEVSVGANAEIGAGSMIRSGTRISSGVFLPSNSDIGQDVFIGPGTVFTDDKYPRAGNKDYQALPPYVGDGASIGAGCVVLPGVRIGAGAMIGAGTVVTHDVQPYTQLYNPISVRASQLMAASTQ